MSMETSCSLPRRNPEKASRIHHAPLPTPCMYSLSFPSVCKREVSQAVPWTCCCFYPWNVSHFCFQKDEWGCRNAESAHDFGFARRASIERWLLTDQFTSQLIGKSRQEGGEWGTGGFRVSHVQCVISPPSIFCFSLCVCVSAQSFSVVRLFETTCTVARQAFLSGFCLLRENGQ